MCRYFSNYALNIATLQLFMQISIVFGSISNLCMLKIHGAMIGVSYVQILGRFKGFEPP